MSFASRLPCPYSRDVFFLGSRKYLSNKRTRSLDSNECSEPMHLQPQYPRPTHPEGPSQANSKAANRKRPAVYAEKACSHCKNSHVACDAGRPCKRCIRLNRASSCTDAERKKRGRPTNLAKEFMAITASQAAVPGSPPPLPPLPPPFVSWPAPLQLPLPHMFQHGKSHHLHAGTSVLSSDSFSMLPFDQNGAYTQNNANLDSSQDNQTVEPIAHFQSSGSSIDALIFGGLSSPSVRPTDSASVTGAKSHSIAAPPIPIPPHANGTDETSNTVSSNIPNVAISQPPSQQKLLAPESDQQQQNEQIPNIQPPVRPPDANVVASVPIQPAPFSDSAASSASQLPRFHETLMKKNATATMNPIRALIVSHIGAKQFNQAAAALKQQQQQQSSSSSSSSSRWVKSADPKRRFSPQPNLFQRVKRASPNTKKRKEGTGKEAISTATDPTVLFGGLEGNPSSQFASSQNSAPGKKTRRGFGRKELANTPPITESSAGHFTGTSNLNQFFGSGLSSSSISNVGHESSSTMRMISVDEILEQAGVLGLGTTSGLVASPSTMNARLIADLNAGSMDAGNAAAETQVTGLNIDAGFPGAESKSGAAPVSASVDEDNGLSDILQQLIRGILSSDGGQTDYGAGVGDGQHGDSQDDVMQAVSALSMLLPDDLTKALTCSSVSADTENDAVTASIEAAAKALISTLLENGDSTEDFLNKSLSPDGPLFQHQQDPQNTQNPQNFQFNTTPSAASASSSTSSSFPSPMTTGYSKQQGANGHLQQQHQQQHHSISSYHNPHQRPPRQQHNPALPKSAQSGLYPNAATDFLYELDHVSADGTAASLKAPSSTLHRPSQLANQRKGPDKHTSSLQSHELQRLGDPLQHLAGIGTSLLDFSLLSANGEGGGSNSSGAGRRGGGSGAGTSRTGGGEDRVEQGWVSQENAERQNPSGGGSGGTGAGCSNELILEELDRMFDDSMFDV
ncbi:hypothetical protein BJ741DRAFT_70361 [Chytriomyces cf. hyalinus JEL632]|nr:hypothetical protein BJ741DRAFT_70361 [Chytriomyces cf. hyalinus JEL632]